MPSALVVHASRHGATAGIAERIGAVLRQAGIGAVVAPASDLPDPDEFDACIVGAGVYMGSWVKDGTDFLDCYGITLAAMPVWLFSSGPLPGSSKEVKGSEVDPIEEALGPATGPGSGGRRKVEALAARIAPVEHRVFQGAFNRHDPPRSMSERFVRMMPGSGNLLPTGDFREWDAIEAWAREIAAAVTSRTAEPVPA